MKRCGKLYVMGVDQMVLPLTRHFEKEGSIATIAALLERSAACKALASFPSDTKRVLPEESIPCSFANLFANENRNGAGREVP